MDTVNKDSTTEANTSPAPAAPGGTTTTSTPAVVDPAVAGTGAPAAAVEKTDEPKTVLDAVFTALDAKEKAKTAASAVVTPGADTAAPKVDDKTATPAADATKTGHEPKTAPERIQQLLGQNKTLAETNASLAPKAQSYDQVNDWTVKNRLSGEDVSYGLALVAAEKNNPAEALRLIEPFYQRIKAAMGEVLPQDLQERVTSGEISEAAGKELAKARAEAQRATANNEAMTNEQRAEEEGRRRTQFAETVKAAVANYETEWKASDPDFAKKYKFVQSEIHAIWQLEGLPKSPEAAVEQIKKARKNVDEQLGAIVPVRGNTNMPSGQGRVASNEPAPKTAQEAVFRSLGIPA
jgi:uncharacterized protein (DUF2384 family)